MLEITAALTMLFWTLGLFSGSAPSAAIYVLPVVALTAIGLRVYDSVRNRASDHSLPREEVESTPARNPQSVQATQPERPNRSATEHARAA